MVHPHVCVHGLVRACVCVCVEHAHIYILEIRLVILGSILYVVSESSKKIRSPHVIPCKCN